MLCAGDEAKKTSGKILRPETKAAPIRTQLWPDRPFAWPLAEHLLSARQERMTREAIQPPYKCGK